jgi:hypothetical protein
VGSFEAGENVKLQPKGNRNIKNVSKVSRQFPVGHKKIQTQNYPLENMKSQGMYKDFFSISRILGACRRYELLS